MKRTLSVLLTFIMLVGMFAVGTLTTSATEAEDNFKRNYIPLSYIVNTNGQFIKTDCKAGKNVTVTMDLEITSWGNEEKGWSSIFGSRSSNHSPNSFVMCQHNKNNYLRSEVGSNSFTTVRLGLNERSTLSLSGTDKFGGDGLDIFLFGLNSGNSYDGDYGIAVYKLYSCKITDGETVIRDFVPAQSVSDGAVGLYDFVSGRLFKSSSVNNFEAIELTTDDPEFSENYTELEYIWNTKQQYIKTGYYAGRKVTIDLDLELTFWNREWSDICGARDYPSSPDSICISHSSTDESVYLEIGGRTDTVSFKTNVRSKLSVCGNSNYYGPGLEIYLFGINEDDQLSKWNKVAIYKLYACKITDGNVVVRNYIPAQRKSDNIIGLFDLKTRVFYASASDKCFEPTDDHCHTFTREGVCTGCGTVFSEDDQSDFQPNGAANWTKSVRFIGAEEITVNVVYTAEPWYALPGFKLIDASGETTTESLIGTRRYNYTLTGDNVTLKYEQVPAFGDVVIKILPVYPGENEVGSVFSEGSLWIIVAVAVIALGGIAALVIVKKKKKPVTENGASTEDKE